MAKSLEQKTTKELQVLAKKAGIASWHKMRKSELLETLTRSQTISEKKKQSKSAVKTSVVSKKERVSVQKTKPVKETDLKKNAEVKTPVRKKAVSVKPAISVEVKPSSSREKAVKSGSPLKNPPKKKIALKRLASEKAAVPVIVKETKTIADPDRIVKPQHKKASVPVTLISGKKEKKTVLKEKVSEKGFSSINKGDAKTDSTASRNFQNAKNREKVQNILSLEPNEQRPSFMTSPAAQIPIKKNTPLVIPKPEKPLDEVQQRIQLLKEKLMLHKTLCSPVSNGNREAKDQLILMVRDPFWLHAYWEVSAPLVERVRAAMGHLWHTADPILRLYKVHTDNVGALRQEFITDIQIHGGINNWYIDVDDPPSSFLVEIGYLARDGQFFVLLSSNIVETPQRYIHDAFGHPDVSWMGIPPDFCSGVFTDTLNKSDYKQGPAGSEKIASLVSDETRIIPNAVRDFSLNVDSEIVIKGKTEPGVQLTIKGEKIRLKEDGSFSIRYHLPERRHVFPIVAISSDGIETQTVILAFERNTKVLDTVIKDEELE